MPNSTTNLNLYKYDTSTDGALTFNIKDCLNDNWDKIDTYCKNLSDNKADTSTVTASLALKADTSTVNTALALKADKITLHALKSYEDAGELLTDAEGLSDVIKYAHSTFDLSKFTVVGNPVITDDGVAQPFTTSNRLSTGVQVGTLAGKSWEITTAKMTYNSTSLTTRSDLISASTNDYLNLCYSYNNQSAQFIFRTGTSGEYENKNLSYSINFAQHTSMQLRVSFDITTGVYSFYANIDDAGFELVGSYTATTTNKELYDINQNPTNTINIASSVYPVIYPQDLKYLEIKANNIPVFSGNRTGIDTIKPDDYTVVGTPTISADGVVTGFEAQKYISCSLTSSTTSNIKIKLPSFTTSNDVTSMQMVATGSNISTFMAFIENSTGKFNIWFGDGSNWVWTINNIFNGAVTANTTYNIEIEILNDIANVYNNGTLIKTQDFTSFSWVIPSTINIGSRYSWNIGSPAPFLGSIDLNPFKIYVVGDLVYQPCLKIPYTKGSEQYGGKYVNAQYLPRVKDAYEQGLANDYFTLDEVNGTYTLPMGNLYGMLEKLNQLAKDEIGLPKATLSNTLNDNEIWLEGAEVSKITYAKLYAIYGDDYGTPSDSANFVLPDFRNRVMQGIGSGGTFGYISAGLPNITGSADPYTTNSNASIGIRNTSGALYSSETGSVISRAETNSGQPIILNIDASRSSSIYGNSTTVQPPAIKVRVKTRYA